MTATLVYLPFLLLAGTFSVIIVIGLATGSLALGGRGRRPKFHWQRHEPPPLPDPVLGPNRRARPLVEPPDGVHRWVAPDPADGRPPSDPEVPAAPSGDTAGGSRPPGP